MSDETDSEDRKPSVRIKEVKGLTTILETDFENKHYQALVASLSAEVALREIDMYNQDTPKIVGNLMNTIFENFLIGLGFENAKIRYASGPTVFITGQSALGREGDEREIAEGDYVRRLEIRPQPQSIMARAYFQRLGERRGNHVIIEDLLAELYILTQMSMNSENKPLITIQTAVDTTAKQEYRRINVASVEQMDSVAKTIHELNDRLIIGKGLWGKLSDLRASSQLAQGYGIDVLNSEYFKVIREQAKLLSWK